MMSAPRSYTSTDASPAPEHSERPERLPGKPRIAIMGEFSAGKSTLSNMLIGRQALPIKVTATQLPPVWISHGDAQPYRRTLDGEDVPITLDAIEEVPLDDTEYIRIFHETDTLQMFDLMDLPGISDPNMPATVWERAMANADAVIWCTHATQAWRQSEAAVWDCYAEQMSDRALLLVTRFDKIVGDRDRSRVLNRLTQETEGLFRGIFPISLTQALAAENNFDLWEKSGADAFATALIELARDVVSKVGETSGGDANTPAPMATDNVTHLPQRDHAQAASPVMPRRVAAPLVATDRPPRPTKAEVSPLS